MTYQEKLAEIISDLRNNLVTKCVPVVINGGGYEEAARMSDKFEAEAMVAINALNAKTLTPTVVAFPHDRVLKACRADLRKRFGVDT